MLGISYEEVTRDEEYGRLLLRRHRGDRLSKAEQRRFHRLRNADARRSLRWLVVFLIGWAAFIGGIVYMYPKNTW
jgi:hypothetical protein